MQDNNFSQALKSVTRANSKIVKCRARCWFLKACLCLNVRPVTLRSRARDPAAHQIGYTPEQAAAWARAQHIAGGALVRAARERERARLVELLQSGREMWDAAKTQVGEGEWQALSNRVEDLDNVATRVRRREHGVKLKGLLREAGFGIPVWLNRTAGSRLEGTATILGETVPLTSTPSQRSAEQPGSPGHPLSAPPANRGRGPGEKAPIFNLSLSILTPDHRDNQRSSIDDSSRESQGGVVETEEESSTETFLSAQSASGSRSQCRRGRGRAKFRRNLRRKMQREKPRPPDLFFNYTNLQLTEAMKSVLNLGPNFVPDRPHVNPVDISVGNLRMRRDMEWDAFFQIKEKERREEEGEDDEDEAEEGKEVRVLKDPQVKTNRPRKWRKPAALTEFENANLLNLTSSANLSRIHLNFSPLLQAAVRDMNDLSRRREWVIKPSDKNGGLALMPFEAYDQAMREKLAQKFTDANGNEGLKYPKASKQQLAREFRLLKSLVEEGREKGWIGDKDAAIAMPSEPTPARLYGNPKVHKPTREDLGIPPLREIVSCSGSNTEGLGKLVDSVTRPVDESCNSFLQDTPHLLRLIEDLNTAGPQPEGTYIFSLDVVALYPSVPTSQGPEVLRKRLLKAGLAGDLVDWITKCSRALLECNTFEYDSNLYTQRDGAGIGQPQACSYAGIFMAEVEEEGLRKYKMRGGANWASEAGNGELSLIIREKPSKGRGWKHGDRAEVDWWHRFRDDCLGLFRGTEAEFKVFVDTMNSINPAIQFTSEINFEVNSVNFLDTIISIDAEGFLRTDLYTKPNTLNQLLLPSSSHPPSVTRGSVYSLAIRLRRICCTDELFEMRAQELSHKLLERGYAKEIVEAGVRRAREVNRIDALKKVERSEGGEIEGRQHHLIVEYDRRSSPALGQILKNNYEAACSRDTRFRALFKKPPKPTFKKGTNLKQMLVKAKVPKVRPAITRAGERENRRGVSRCSKGTGRNQCGKCHYFTDHPREVIKEVTVSSTGENIRIEDQINCKTKSCIYLLESRKDPTRRQYGGQTGATIGTRAGQHAYDIDTRADKPVSNYFSLTGSTKDDLRVTPVMRVKTNNPWVRLHLERLFINKHNLVEDGINTVL